MRILLFVLVLLLAAAIALAGWTYLIPMLSPASRDAGGAPYRTVAVGDAAQARRTVENILHEAPEFAAFFDALRDRFPADYAQDVDTFASRASQSGRADPSEVYLSQALRALRQTRGILAAKAGPQVLTRVFDSQTAVLKALGEADPHLCVDFLYGGATQAYFDFAARHRGLVAATATADLDAIVDGQNRQIQRPKPSEDDFRGLEGALRGRGLSQPEINAVIDGQVPNPPIDDARLCTVAQIKNEALATLPPDERLRIYGLAIELMARS